MTDTPAPTAATEPGQEAPLLIADETLNQQARALRVATEHRLCPICHEALMLHQAAFLQCAHAVCTNCFTVLRSRQRRFTEHAKPPSRRIVKGP